jgi:hypothetical protein
MGVCRSTCASLTSARSLVDLLLWYVLPPRPTGVVEPVSIAIGVVAVGVETDPETVGETAGMEGMEMSAGLLRGVVAGLWETLLGQSSESCAVR